MPRGERSPRTALPARRLLPAAGSGLLGCLLLACATGRPGPVDPVSVGGAPSSVTLANPGQGPLWNALAAAVDDRDDDLASVLLERLRPLAVTDQERERLDAFERVLAGRRVARSVDLRLVSEPGGEAGRHKIVLLARSSAPHALELRLPPAPLTCARSAVTPDGGFTRELHTHIVDVLEHLELPPGRTTRHVLAEQEVPLGQALAVRERWSLEPLSGEWQTPDGTLPASRIAVEPCERVRLARELPLAPVPLAELLRYAREAEIRTPALLERAVRLPSPQHERALEALAPLVSEWAKENPERVLALAPALRWLAGGGQGGLQPEEWAAVLEERGRPAERARLELGDRSADETR